jgi:hypothetical protein
MKVPFFLGTGAEKTSFRQIHLDAGVGLPRLPEHGGTDSGPGQSSDFGSLQFRRSCGRGRRDSPA